LPPRAMIWVGSCVLWSRRRRRWSRAWRQWTSERDELREHLVATSDDLGRQLRAVEQAKTEVEQSLEAMTSERDELQENLLSLKNEYDSVVASCEKLRVDMSLAESAHQNELSVLRGEKDAFAAELRRVSFRLDASEVRLKYLRSLCKSAGLGGSAESGEDYQVTRSVLAMRRT
ncbi:kinesin-like protein, partial [Trypanosoma cruzi]